MSAPTSPPAWRLCWPLTLVVSIFMTCVIVPMCFFAALQLNAGYWFLLHNAVGFEPRAAQAQGPAGPVTPTGDDPVSVGQAVFANTGCAACHSLAADTVLVGPSLAGLAARAGETVPGQSAEDYLRESIVDPEAHVVDGFPAHVMPGNFGRRLTTAEIEAVIAYLLSR